MRRMLLIAVGLVVMAGLLGAFGLPSTSSAQPTVVKQNPPPGVIKVTVRGNAIVTITFGKSKTRPKKPFYGTMTLRLRALGLDPATRVCGNVWYTGQVSGFNTICSDLSRWIWVQRGRFVSAGLQITTRLPGRCRLPAPHTPPRVSQRVNITFTIDCRKAKPAGPKKPKPTGPTKPTPPASPPGLQPNCSSTEQLTLVFSGGHVGKITIPCGGIVLLPPGAHVTVCLFQPAGSQFWGLPAGVLYYPGKTECIQFVVPGYTVVVNVDIKVTTTTTTVTTTTTTTTTTTPTTPPGGGPANPNP